MKKLFVIVSVVFAIMVGIGIGLVICKSSIMDIVMNDKETNVLEEEDDYSFVKGITTNEIVVRPIEVEEIQVENIETENIEVEDVIIENELVETWDNSSNITRW